MSTEELRLEASRQRKQHWKRSGPYLSERAWGTVREDYSEYGTAWEYFPHDHARSMLPVWRRREPAIAPHVTFGLSDLSHVRVPPE